MINISQMSLKWFFKKKYQKTWNKLLEICLPINVQTFQMQ
jgi:hypothetical protein